MPPLTDEQRLRIEANKAAALAKRAEAEIARLDDAVPASKRLGGAKFDRRIEFIGVRAVCFVCAV